MNAAQVELYFDEDKATFNLLICSPNVKVSALFSITLYIDWNNNALETFFRLEFVSSLQSINRLQDSSKDMLFWKRTRNGTFSTKEAYWSIAFHRFHPWILYGNLFALEDSPKLSTYQRKAVCDLWFFKPLLPIPIWFKLYYPSLFKMPYGIDNLVWQPIRYMD